MPKAKTNNALQKSTAQGRAFFASKKPSGPRMAFVCLCLTCHLCTAHRGGRLLNPQPALGRRCVAAGLVFANIRAFGSPSAKSVSLPFSRRFYLILCVVFAEMVFNLFSLGGTMFGTLRLANPSCASFPRLHHTGKLWYAVGQNPKHFAPMRKKGQEEMIPLPFFMLICPMHRPLALGRNATYFCRITDEACTLPMSIPAFPTKHALGQ